jgi:hypothetical protein
MRPALAAAVLASSMILGGCVATVGDALAGKAGGTAVVYPVPPARAWAISEKILHDAGSGPIEEHRDEGYMATQFVNIYGVAAVWIEAAGPDSKVTVVTLRGLPTWLISPLEEADFHGYFREALRGAPKDGAP